MKVSSKCTIYENILTRLMFNLSLLLAFGNNQVFMGALFLLSHHAKRSNYQLHPSTYKVIPELL